MKQTFTDWLCEAVPKSASYPDVANLCISLYCTADILPEHLHDGRYTKEVLAEAFATLTHRRFGPDFGRLFSSGYGTSFHQPTDKGHWLEVMASVFKLAQQPDIESAVRLISATA